MDLFNPVLPTLARQASGNPTNDNLGRFETMGLYVQDMISIDEQWKVLAGLRYNHFKQETGERNTGRQLQRTDNDISPRLGVVYQPDAAQSYYLSWSRSFQPSGEAFALSSGNANLDPEQTTNTEIGANLLGYVTADAAAWWRQSPWGVRLNVYNITDARYIVSSQGANGNMNLPGTPRNVMLTLSYRMISLLG